MSHYVLVWSDISSCAECQALVSLWFSSSHLDCDVFYDDDDYYDVDLIHPKTNPQNKNNPITKTSEDYETD